MSGEVRRPGAERERDRESGAPDLVDRAQGHHHVVLLLLVQLDALHLLALVQLLRSEQCRGERVRGTVQVSVLLLHRQSTATPPWACLVNYLVERQLNGLHASHVRLLAHAHVSVRLHPVGRDSQEPVPPRTRRRTRLVFLDQVVACVLDLLICRLVFRSESSRPSKDSDQASALTHAQGGACSAFAVPQTHLSADA